MKKFIENLSRIICLFVFFAITATVVAVLSYFLGLLDSPLSFVLSNAIIFTALVEVRGLSYERERKRKMKERMRDRDW